MKLISHYFESVAGIEIYPIISFLIFFAFFLAVTYMVIKMDKKEVTEMSNLPLEGEDSTESISKTEL